MDLWFPSSLFKALHTIISVNKTPKPQQSGPGFNHIFASRGLIFLNYNRENSSPLYAEKIFVLRIGKNKNDWVFFAAQRVIGSRYWILCNRQQKYVPLSETDRNETSSRAVTHAERQWQASSFKGQVVLLWLCDGTD